MKNKSKKPVKQDVDYGAMKVRKKKASITKMAGKAKIKMKGSGKSSLTDGTYC